MKGYEVFLPLYAARRKWADRYKEIKVPVFANYLFCQFDAQALAPIITTPGVIRIVSNGKSPVEVDGHEIEWVRAIVNSGLQAEPWQRLVSGARVMIENGPLRGIEGNFLSLDRRHQLVVTVTLLQRSLAVTVNPAWIKPLDMVPFSFKH